MPKIPHWYTIRAWNRELEPDFEFFVMYIREHGYEKRFGTRTYMYLDVGEHSYWTMGAPLKDTILINRAMKQGEPSSFQGELRLAHSHEIS